MLIPLGILATAGAGGAGGGAYELIQSAFLTTDTASVTFSAIPQTYKHLEVRYTVRATGNNFLHYRENGLTSGYRNHQLFADGFVGTDSTTGTFGGSLVSITNSDELFTFAAGIVTYLDYASTTKNKTMMAITGAAGSSRRRVSLVSGSVFSTTALTSLEFFSNNNSLTGGSRFSLYGIKGT